MDVNISRNEERKDGLGTGPHQYVEQYDLDMVCANALYTISALLLSSDNRRQRTQGYVGLHLTFVTAGNDSVVACWVYRLISFLLYGQSSTA